MSQHQLLIEANFSELIIGCSQEQAHYTSINGCCFELFRRALEGRDEHAWLAIQQQFRPLFTRWILETITIQVDHCVVEDLFQIALERFWCALSGGERPLTERFLYTGALLKYMKQCIRTACWEWQRREIRQQRLQKQLTLTMVEPPAQRPLEQLWSQSVHASRCATVRHWLAEQCRNEAELLVYRLTYEEDLKPRQIVAQHPEHFPAVQDVYRIKLRLYRRIQRSFGWGE